MGDSPPLILYLLPENHRTPKHLIGTPIQATIQLCASTETAGNGTTLGTSFPMDESMRCQNGVQDSAALEPNGRVNTVVLLTEKQPFGVQTEWSSRMIITGDTRHWIRLRIVRLEQTKLLSKLKLRLRVGVSKQL